MKPLMRVRVHLNLHTKEWSVARNGKVIVTCGELVLSDARCIVSQSGRRRCLKQRVRNVHAWIEGNLISEVPAGRRMSISYNPYRAAYFYDREKGREIRRCNFVHFTKRDGAVMIL
jgi:hypothetical protein